MGKKDNSVRKTELENLISAERKKIEAVNDSIEALRNYDTTVDYTLKSHGNIKSTYQLAGTPYKNMADDEKTTVKTVGTKFGGVRDEMVLDLVSASRGMSMNISVWQAELSGLD